MHTQTYNRIPAAITSQLPTFIEKRQEPSLTKSRLYNFQHMERLQRTSVIRVITAQGHSFVSTINDYIQTLNREITEAWLAR